MRRVRAFPCCGCCPVASVSDRLVLLARRFCGRATRDRTLMAALHRLFEPVGPSHLRRPSHKHRKGNKRRRNRGERDRGSRRDSSHPPEEGSRRPSNEAHPSPGDAPAPATALGEAADATATSGSGVTGVQEWGAEPGVFAAGGAGADATPPKPTAAPTNTPTASKPASPSGSHRPHAAHASSTPSRRHGGAHPATPAGAAAQLQEGVSGASPTHTPVAPQRDGTSARRHSRHRGRAHRSRHNRIVDGDSHLDLLTRGDTDNSLLAEPAESPQRTMESPPHRPRHRHQGAAGATNGGAGHVVDDTPFATGVTPPSSLAALRAGARAEMGSADLEARFQRHDSGSMRGMLTPTSPATGGVGGSGSSSNGRRGQHPRSRHHRQARKHSQRLLQHSPVRVPAARGNHSTHQASPARPTPSKVKLTALPDPTQPKASLPPTMLDSSEVRPASPV